MSRLQTQTRPLDSGGVPTGGGGVSAGNFTPVVDNTAGDILSLIQGVTGIVTAVQQEKKQRTAEQLQSDYSMSEANLIRLREEAIRDPSKEAVFLSAYDAAQQKFNGTPYAPRLVSMGEGTKTDFQQRADRMAGLAADAFFDTRVIPAVKDSISTPEVQERLLAIPDYSDRLTEIQRIVQDVMPDNAASVLGDSAEQRILEASMQINDRMQGAAEDRITQARKKTEDSIYDAALISYATRESSYEDFVSKMETLKVDPTVYSRELAVYMDGAVTSAYISGSADDLHKASAAAWDAWSSTSDPVAKGRLAQVVATADAARGELASDQLGLLWSDTYATRGLEAANAAVDAAARDLLSLEYGNEAFTVADISMLPESGFRKGYKSSILGTAKRLTVKAQDAGNLPDKIVNAINAFRSPEATIDGTPSGLLNLSAGDWTQVAKSVADDADAFTQAQFSEPRAIAGIRITNGEEYAGLLAAAAVNPVLRAAVVADKFSTTRHAGGIARDVLSDDYLKSDDGIQITIATMNEMGGESAILKHTDDTAKQYALLQTLRQPADRQTAAVYAQNMQTYQQARFKVGNLENATINDVLGSEDFVKAFVADTAGVNRKRYTLDENSKQQILAMFPLEAVSGQKEMDASLVASKVKEHMKRVGANFVWERSQYPGGRPSFSIVTSKSIPEAVGLDTPSVEESLSTTSSMSLYMANQLSGGESKTMMSYAARRWDEEYGTGAFSKAYGPVVLDQMVKDGTAFFRVNSSSAGDRGVPVQFVVSEPGKTSVVLELGLFDFNQPLLRDTSPAFLKSVNTRKPKPLVSAKDVGDRLVNPRTPRDPDPVGRGYQRIEQQLSMENIRKQLGLDK